MKIDRQGAGWWLVNGELRHYTMGTAGADKGKVFGPWQSEAVAKLELDRVIKMGLEADECWARDEAEARLVFTLRERHGL